MSDTESKFFVIDDDESVRASLSRLLRSAGFHCKTFGCAEDFIAELPAGAEGCAIVDIHMPGMNGIELMRALRRSNPNMQIVLITAFEDPDARKEAREAGVETLRKPFDDSALLNAVTRFHRRADDPAA